MAPAGASLQQGLSMWRSRQYVTVTHAVTVAAIPRASRNHGLEAWIQTPMPLSSAVTPPTSSVIASSLIKVSVDTLSFQKREREKDWKLSAPGLRDEGPTTMPRLPEPRKR